MSIATSLNLNQRVSPLCQPDSKGDGGKEVPPCLSLATKTIHKVLRECADQKDTSATA